MDRPSLPVRAGLALLVALAVNVALVFAAGAAGVAPGFRALAVPPVAFLTVVGVLGAAVLYRLMSRLDAGRDRSFVRVAAAVLLLSFLPDVALLRVDPAATLPGVVVLMAMHVAVAAAAVWALVRWRR